MLKLADLARRADFAIGPLHVSPARRLVEGPVGSTTVEPIVMKVFLLLLDGAGSVVTRDELFGNAWGGVYVGDDSLNRAVARVRKIASDTAPGLFEIETIPRTGYRVTGEILQFIDTPAPAEAAKAVAVSRRGMISGGAAAALAIAGAGAWWWTSRPRQADPRAQALVDRADGFLRSDLYYSNDKVADLLRKAVAIDPDNAKAWGLLAYALAAGSDDDGATQSVDRATAINDAIRHAQAIDPNESNALLSQFIAQHSLRDWMPADENLRRVLRVDPRNTYAMVRLVALLQAAGLNHESLVWNERQIAIDPLSPGPQFRRALKYWISGQVSEADITADQVMQRWPHHPTVWNARFIIYAFTGRPRAALAMLNDDSTRPDTLTPMARKTWQVSLDALDQKTPAAIAAAREVNVAGARKAPLLAAYGVMFLSALGEIDAAFDIANGFLLGRGPILTPRPTNDGNFTTSVGWRMTQWLFTPPVAGLRADPRFKDICDGIGLTGYWRKRGVRPDYLLPRP